MLASIQSPKPVPLFFKLNSTQADQTFFLYYSCVLVSVTWTLDMSIYHLALFTGDLL